MNSDYLNRLPSDVRELVTEIERECSIEIGVRVDPARVRERPDRSDTMACDMSEDGATILIPAEDHFPDGSVLHEFLHIQRFLLQGVPRIGADLSWSGWNIDFEQSLTTIDNRLEHLVIVPREIDLRPERTQHFSAWRTRKNRVALASREMVPSKRRDAHDAHSKASLGRGRGAARRFFDFR